MNVVSSTANGVSSMKTLMTGSAGLPIAASMIPSSNSNSSQTTNVKGVCLEKDL